MPNDLALPDPHIKLLMPVVVGKVKKIFLAASLLLSINKLFLNEVDLFEVAGNVWSTLALGIPVVTISFYQLGVKNCHHSRQNAIQKTFGERE